MSKGNILSPKEEIIMSCIWLHGPLRVKEIIELLPEPKPHFNTVSTFVRGLQSKGWITHERYGNTHRYSAKVPINEYRMASLERIANYLFSGNYESLVDFLLCSGKLNKDSIPSSSENLNHH